MCTLCTENGKSCYPVCLSWQNQRYTLKLIIVQQTGINVVNIEEQNPFVSAGGIDSPWQRETLLFAACSNEQRLVILVSSPTETVALWGFSMSRVDSGGVSMGLSSSSGAWPSPRDQTDLRERHSVTRCSRLSLLKDGGSNTVEE